MLDENLRDDTLDEEQRKAIEAEKEEFERMSEKEQKKWVEFKMGKARPGRQHSSVASVMERR